MVGGGEKVGYGREAEKAGSSFDLPFEGRKEEKVVINSLLFIPPCRSLGRSLSLFYLSERKS